MTDSATTSTSSPARARVTVCVPGPLRALAAGAGELSVRAATVRDALDDVLERHPGLRRHLRTETGSIREHVNIFLNDDDIRYGGGEGARVVEGDTVTIVPSIAGG